MVFEWFLNGFLKWFLKGFFYGLFEPLVVASRTCTPRLGGKNASVSVTAPNCVLSVVLGSDSGRGNEVPRRKTILSKERIITQNGLVYLQNVKSLIVKTC